ncbi:MAG: cysteine dioxygenase type [Herminiimonas sp.]|nr:cysteine dioxygenase type [Herminiimonas sp.]MDB5853905.1 cysteine dioxygenase type [Herminiimonas sp.]
MQYTTPFQHFVQEFSRLIDASAGDEPTILKSGGRLMSKLVSNDDWLPAEFAQPDPQYYQQYLLHCDPKERFSVVSFVWGPGQKTPVHDHTVWALIGMLRGAERSERFALEAPGQPMRVLGDDVLQTGHIDCVSPTLGDIHRVSNMHQDRVSISIHAYGGNIGTIRRHVYDVQTGNAKEFVSGYSNAPKTVA